MLGTSVKGEVLGKNAVILANTFTDSMTFPY